MPYILDSKLKHTCIDFSEFLQRIRTTKFNELIIETSDSHSDKELKNLKDKIGEKSLLEYFKNFDKEDDEKINLRFKELIADASNDSLAPFVIVKTIPTTKWKNVVNAIDELNITNVKKRAIMDMEAREALLFLSPGKVAELKLK